MRLNNDTASRTLDAATPAWKLTFKDRALRAGSGIAIDSFGATSVISSISTQVGPQSNSENQLTTTYSGVLQFTANQVPITVRTIWTSSAESPDLKGRIEVDAPGLESSSHYLSIVTFPNFSIPTLGPGEVVAAAIGGGQLFLDPVQHNCHSKGIEPHQWWSFPLLAHYLPGQDDALYLSNTDLNGTVKEIAFAGRSESGHLDFFIEQFLNNPFVDNSYASPYSAVVSHIKGDWVDATEKYRDEFFSINAPWYDGPVGSNSSGRGQRIKEALWMGTIQQLGHVAGDPDHGHYEVGNQSLDWDFSAWDVVNETMVYTDVFGSGTAIYYELGGLEPYDQFYVQPAGDNPPMPDTSDAINHLTTNAEPLQAAGRYVQGSIARDPDDHGNHNSYTDKIKNAAILDEAGNEVTFSYHGTDTHLFLCPFDDFWQLEIPLRTVLGVELTANNGLPTLIDASYSYLIDYLTVAGPLTYERGDYTTFHDDKTIPGDGLNAVYLDFWMAAESCFNPNHGHPIGSRTAIFAGKQEQVRLLRLAKGPEFTIAAEGVVGVFTQYVDQMHNSPFVPAYGISNRFHAQTLPMFRMAFPNVNMGDLRVEGPPTAMTMGYSAFLQTIKVLQRGQLFSWGSYVANADNAPWMWVHPEGEPHRYYFTQLAQLFRQHGLLHFHKGTLVRPPQTTTCQPGDFSQFPEGPFGPGELISASFGPAEKTGIPHGLSLLPHGMYREPNGGTYAFVISNPWIGPSPFVDDASDMGYETLVNLNDYPGLNATSLSVSIISTTGFAEQSIEAELIEGKLRLHADRLNPGETHFYKIRSQP